MERDPDLAAQFGDIPAELVYYRGRLAATVTPTTFDFAEWLDDAPAAERAFVLSMGVYARAVFAGTLPGPYNGTFARFFARRALIPGELLEREALDFDRAAEALTVPLRELHAAWVAEQLREDEPD
ncbi:MAG: hypothetical protein JWQ48_317 [Conexibacter sp.]|nr:hypothetical protein [Conexibacter sp.]